MKKIKKIVLGVVLAFSLTGVGFILGNIEDSVKVTDNSNSTEFDLKLPGEVEKRTVTKTGRTSRKPVQGIVNQYKKAVDNLGRTAKQGIFLRVLSVGNRIVSASSDTMAVRYRQTCRTT